MGPVGLSLLVAASAAAYGFGSPGYGLGFLAWIGIAPFFHALRQGGVKLAAGFGFLFGAVFVLTGFRWFFQVADVHIPNYLAAVCAFSLFFLLFGVLYNLLSRRAGILSFFGGPALWVAFEFLRSNISFLSLPWNLLGHTQYLETRIIQIADFSGVYGVSFVLALSNQFLSELPGTVSRWKGTGHGSFQRALLPAGIGIRLLIVLGVVAATLVYGYLSRSAPAGDRRIRVALVQANTIPKDDMPYAEVKRHLERYNLMTREAAKEKPDLIVWPASSLPAPLSNLLVRFSLIEIQQMVRIPLLVGGSGREKDSARRPGDPVHSNSEFLLSPGGRVEGTYHKIRLLPFNEYLPLERWIGWPGWITNLKSSFIPGTEYTLFSAGGARFGTPICWENMFPEDFRRFVLEGADFMVGVTNEGFLGRTKGPYQTLATYVFRAVENRVAVVRSAPTGVSAFIGPDGEILSRVRNASGEDLYVPGILVRDIPLETRRGFYTRHGDVFAALSTVFAGIALAFSLPETLRDRREKRPRG
ncbi:MAG: lnt [Deltaproteobacteria bacterium]|nr:lnt [Deltaproteobacteria bacterium]